MLRVLLDKLVIILIIFLIAGQSIYHDYITNQCRTEAITAQRTTDEVVRICK